MEEEEEVSVNRPLLQFSDTGLQLLFVFLFSSSLPSAPPYFPPYGADTFPPAVVPGWDFTGADYDDYSPAGGSRSGFRGRPPTSYGRQDGAYPRPEFG